MTSRPTFFKLRYRDQWPVSNARELYVLGLLNTVFYPRYRAVLTGLGAGSSELIPRSYQDLLEAFDILVVDELDRPVVFIEVTGTREYKRLSCQDGESHLKCVGSWKLRKARKYRVLFSVWSVFITPSGRDRWLHYDWLARNLEAPYVKTCKLVEDEREVYCTPPDRWVRRESFFNWLRTYAAVSRSILSKALGVRA